MRRKRITYYLRNVIEEILVREQESPQKARAQRVRGASSEKKQEQNMRASLRQLARLLNTNFSDEDYSVVLTLWSDELLQLDLEAALTNFLRRLRRELKKLGIRSLKWVAVCSVLDGKTGAVVRGHIHLILEHNPFDLREGTLYLGEKPLEEIWGQGAVYARHLYGFPDYTPLAAYLILQASREPDAKKYRHSKKLIIPTPEIEYVNSATIKQPAGTKPVEHYRNNRFGAEYFRGILESSDGEK